MGRLAGKAGVITQAGSSFGRTLAAAYSDEGANVFLQDWADREERLDTNAEAIKDGGGNVIAGIFDITRGPEVREMAEAVMSVYGRVDVLVNTAMAGGHGRFLDIREEDWNACLDRGLKSYFLTCQNLGEQMARAGYGKIINLTSIVGDLGSGGAVPWGACRAGVNGLTYAVAHALGGYGVRCVALARGATQSTPYTDEARSVRLRRLPLGRLGREEDLIGPAIFLSTPESDWITGSIVYCDGGYVHAAVTDAEHRASGPRLTEETHRFSDEPSAPEWIDTDVP